MCIMKKIHVYNEINKCLCLSCIIYVYNENENMFA